jgi:putative transposase
LTRPDRPVISTGVRWQHQVIHLDGDASRKQEVIAPYLNAFSERWVRSVKDECLSKLILFGESSLSRTVVEFGMHDHVEGNHQGRRNKLLFTEARDESKSRGGEVICRQRLGGLLKYYSRAA